LLAKTATLPHFSVLGVNGPTLPDGRQTVVIVSDNNFAPGQFTQFIVLALDINAVE